MLQDVYSVHCALLFAKYRLKSYPYEEFIDDIKNSEYKVNDIKNIVFNMNIINLYPSYIINDNIFDIWQYFFAASRFINYIKQQRKDIITNKDYHYKYLLFTKYYMYL